MKVVCPKCEFSGNMRDELIPPEGKSINCPKCKASIFVKKEGGPVPENSTSTKSALIKYQIIVPAVLFLCFVFFMGGFFFRSCARKASPTITKPTETETHTTPPAPPLETPLIPGVTDWIPFTVFYYKYLQAYEDAMDIDKGRFIGLPVTATGEVRNIEARGSDRRYGSDSKYILTLYIQDNEYVKVGTSSDVPGINKYDTVTVYGEFFDYTKLGAHYTHLKDGIIMK